MKRLGAVVLLFLIVFVVHVSAEANAAEAIVAVLDFEVSGISVSEAKIIVDYLSARVLETGQFRVIDRSQREAILDEIEFSRSDCVDTSCQLEIGKLLSANMIITGSIGLVGTKYILNIKLLRVETGEAIHSASSKYDSLDDLLEDAAFLVAALLPLKEERHAEQETAFEEESVTIPEEEQKSVEPIRARKTRPTSSRRGFAVELSLGYISTIRDTRDSSFWLEDVWGEVTYNQFLADVPSTYNQSSASIGVLGIYQFSSLFSFGLGISVAPFFQDVEYSSGTNTASLGGSYLFVHTKIVIGNKVDSFAVSMNLATGTPSGKLAIGAGVYYKNIFIDALFFSIPVADRTQVRSGFIVLGGYSLFGQKKQKTTSTD